MKVAKNQTFYVVDSNSCSEFIDAFIVPQHAFYQYNLNRIHDFEHLFLIEYISAGEESGLYNTG